MSSKKVNAIQGTMTLSIAEAEWHIRGFWPATYLRLLLLLLLLRSPLLTL